MRCRPHLCSGFYAQSENFIRRWQAHMSAWPIPYPELIWKKMPDDSDTHSYCPLGLIWMCVYCVPWTLSYCSITFMFQCLGHLVFSLQLSASWARGGEVSGYLHLKPSVSKQNSINERTRLISNPGRERPLSNFVFKVRSWMPLNLILLTPTAVFRAPSPNCLCTSRVPSTGPHIMNTCYKSTD